MLPLSCAASMRQFCARLHPAAAAKLPVNGFLFIASKVLHKRGGMSWPLSG